MKMKIFLNLKNYISSIIILITTKTIANRPSIAYYNLCTLMNSLNPRD